MIKEIRKTVTEEKVVDVEYYCDKCDKEIFYRKDSHSFNVDEFELVRKTGSQYPEGDHIVYQTVHLCGDCGDEIMEYLKNNNYRINVDES